jgi:hypothetical protein
MPEPIALDKMTKRLLMSLETGQYLVSNVFTIDENGRNRPAFAEYVALPAERDRQWRSIKNAEADGRQCAVFASADDFEGWLEHSVQGFPKDSINR